MNTADTEVIRRCLAGDVAAFEEIYRCHSVSLYGLARRMCGRAEDAEDLLQEIFLQAYRKLPSFKGQSALGTWLYRLAVNCCLDHLRSRGRRMATQTGSLDAAPPARTAVRADPVVSRLDLERAIARLPPACRAAFLLHDVEGFEHREVAGILDVSEGTSKSQVHKARLRIRTYLAARRRGDDNDRDL